MIRSQLEKFPRNFLDIKENSGKFWKFFLSILSKVGFFGYFSWNFQNRHLFTVLAISPPAIFCRHGGLEIHHFGDLSPNMGSLSLELSAETKTKLGAERKIQKGTNQKRHRIIGTNISSLTFLNNAEINHEKKAN